MSGVDPTVFRRFFREDMEEIEEETNEFEDKRSQAENFKMPRRRTTIRRKVRNNAEAGGGAEASGGATDSDG